MHSVARQKLSPENEIGAGRRSVRQFSDCLHYLNMDGPVFTMLGARQTDSTTRRGLRLLTDTASASDEVVLLTETIHPSPRRQSL